MCAKVTNFNKKVENLKKLTTFNGEKLQKQSEKSGKLLLPAAAVNLCCTRKMQQSNASNCCSACKHMHKRLQLRGMHFPGADTNFPNNKEWRSMSKKIIIKNAFVIKKWHGNFKLLGSK